MFYGINIKNRCLRLVLLTASMLRIRHYRGHGIHSPFAYSIVRQVFMKRRIKGESREVYNTLRTEHVGRYWAVQLQNLHSFCRNHTLRFVMPNETIACPQKRTNAEQGDDERSKATELCDVADKTIVCIVAPRYSRSRYRNCKALIAHHNGMSIDNRGYILLIYDNKLPKQHFKL